MPRRRRAHPGGVVDRPRELLAITALLLAAGWVLFVGNTHLHEMIVGLVAIALSTGFCRFIYRASTLSIDLRWRDVLQAWRIPGEILKDTGILLMLLAADLFRSEAIGSFYRASGFRSSRRNPILIGRTALAITYATMSPNMIVIGVDPVSNHMLFHQLRPDSLSALAKSLGAGQ